LVVFVKNTLKLLIEMGNTRLRKSVYQPLNVFV
jgi:hypothetical protein